MRLDRFLAEGAGVSRRAAMEAIADGRVRVDGRRARKGDPVVPGQIVVARLAPRMAPPVPQPELDLHVVYEDADLLVVEKPSGWPTHPLAAGERNTLANAIVARHPECAEAAADVREGGVAHRLDTPTSGLVVAARNRESWQALRRQFAERTVRKEYLALVEGAVRGPLAIDVPIAGEPGRPGHFRAVEEARLHERLRAREARTRVEVERRLPGWTLVRCAIDTGVMHQIRVHLAQVGHPIAGDDRYGGAHPAGLSRLFLHATVLGFRHPRTGAPFRFESPLPAELAAVLGRLAATEVP